MTELYKEDLLVLISAMNNLEDIASINGVHEVEIRVRIEDSGTWAILGYGESGDPCVLRFEQDPSPALAPPIPSKTGFIQILPNKLYGDATYTRDINNAF